MEKVCDMCGKTFDANIPFRKYCGKQCSNKKINEQNNIRTLEFYYRNKYGYKPVKKNCLHCNKEFIKKGYKKYCSKKCKYLNIKKIKEEKRVKKNQKKCNYCNKIFIANPENKWYCSKICARQYNILYQENYKQENIEYSRNLRKIYGKHNKEKIKAWWKNRLKTNENFRLRCYLGQWFNSVIKKHKGIKQSKTEELMGCAVKEFKEHIAKQFDSRMSWENHGYRTWHLDHIIPSSSFDLTKKEEQKKCFHYTNFQPLWWTDNMAKSNKILVIANV